MSDVPGIDHERLSAWLVDNIPGAVAPFEFAMITGGHSNVTALVTGADGVRFVVRRPPLGHVLASAHDMSREFRIISGLASSSVPVAPALGFCDDVEVTGAPFYVMAHVEGNVVHDRAEADQLLSLPAQTTASQSLVDTLATIHAVDLRASGLDTLAKHESYIARQLKRWYGQWNAQHTAPLTAIDEAFEALSAHIPEQGPATIVHGDYRLDNCIVDDDGGVVAVLDWEICTLGDPLADLGLLLAYWTGPNDEPSAWTGTATTAPGFWNRADVARRYGEISGRDLSHLDYYLAFAYWKLACVLEGVYARYLGGALGDADAAHVARFRQQVEGAAASSLIALDRYR